MKRLIYIFFLLTICSISFGQIGNDTSKYVSYKYLYGNRIGRSWAEYISMIPTDTIYSKSGIARIGSVFYVGNDILWTKIGAIIDTTTAITGITSLYQNSLKWGINGNSINYLNHIGSTNNASLRFWANGAEKMQLDSLGNLKLNSFSTVTSYAKLFSINSIEDPTNPFFYMTTVGGTSAALVIKPNNSAFSADGSLSNFGPLRIAAGPVDSFISVGDYKGQMFQSPNGFKMRVPVSAGTGYMLSIENNATPTFYIRGNGLVQVGDTTNCASCLFSIKSTSTPRKGFLPPVMTNAQMLAIVAPAVGLQIYNSNVPAVCVWNGAKWDTLGVGGGGSGGAVGSVSPGDYIGIPSSTGAVTVNVDTAALSNVYVRKSNAIVTLVPYSGATADFTLGAHNFYAQTINLTGTGGAGFMTLTGQSVDPTAPGATNQNIYADITGRFKIKGNNGFAETFSTDHLSASRIHYYQDKDYTLGDSARIEDNFEKSVVNGYPVNDSVYDLVTADSTKIHINFVEDKANILTSNVQLANTGNTTENTVYTGTIPANSIGINGHFDILGLVSTPNNANNKTFKVKFNGTTILNRVSTTSAADRWYFSIFNRNSLSAQIAPGSASGQVVGGGTSGTAPATYTFNTGAAITVTVTIQNAVGGDAPALEAFTIMAYP